MTGFTLDLFSVFIGILTCMVADVTCSIATYFLEKAFALRKARREDKSNTPHAGEKEVNL